MTVVDDSPWTAPAFVDEVHAWIAERVTPTGPITQPHIQRWSTVFRVPIADGVVWCKIPEHAWEAPLTVALGRVRPGSVTEVLAADEVTGWMLLADAGRRLHDEIVSPPRPERWVAVLEGCAELQLAAAGEASRFLSLGVPDRRLATIPGAVAALLDRDDLLLLDDPEEGLPRERRDELRAFLPAIGEMCEELAAAGIPESIQHDDLNPGNVYEGDDGRDRIVDWGDACVSHPFHTLTVALRIAAFRFDLTPGGAELLAMRDAYLRPFAAFGSPQDLARLADLGYRTGTLARALAWASYLDGWDPEDRAEDLPAVAYGLSRFLEGGPIGRWQG